jgi:hypothetical protein
MISTLVMRRGGFSLGILLVLGLLAAVMGFLISSIAHTLRHVKPVHATKPPVSGVVWGDLVFSQPPMMAHWLRVHGVAYSVWAQRHPPANRLLKKHAKSR